MRFHGAMTTTALHRSPCEAIALELELTRLLVRARFLPPEDRVRVTVTDDAVIVTGTVYVPAERAQLIRLLAANACGRPLIDRLRVTHEVPPGRIA